MQEGPPGEQQDAGQSGSAYNDCPVGFTRDSSITSITVCKRGFDEVVRVGTKGSAFWIDRYESSVWEKEDGTGKQYGATMDDYPQTFPKNGQLTIPVYAVSKNAVIPSRFITWFQANEACAASGKRLPTNAEWQRAARGTLDPGASSGGGGACLTQGSAESGPRQTGQGTKCVSDWGVQDMTGNLGEWIGEWGAGVGQLGANSVKQPWPDGYGKDGTANIDSATLPSGVIGLPSAVTRDVCWYGGELSGIFAYAVDSAPTRAIAEFGFRCVLSR